MVDWSKLEPYGGTQYRSFEELCYQIAKGLYGHEGRFTSIDDSGGGDGVEFYLTFPDGRQWGWQAKFLNPFSEDLTFEPLFGLDDCHSRNHPSFAPS